MAEIKAINSKGDEIVVKGNGTVSKDGKYDQTNDLIVAQALREILWDRRYKQGKIRNWQKNEEQYYAMKIPMQDARANVELGRMQEFVHTLLSKIRRPLVFKYVKRKNSQTKRVKLLNGLVEADRKLDSWNVKDLVGKKQLAIYGRMVYSYHSQNESGDYQANLENIDVYDFLIDPAGGGIDMEKAKHMGNYGVILMRDELEAGIKDEKYIIQAAQDIIAGSGNNDEVNQEETNKLTRIYGQNTIGKKELHNEDKFKFWRWFTTYKGERYYLLLQERAGRAIRIEKLTDMFSASELYPKAPWPYWTAAAFPDLTEFWTPSYCDYVREIFMAQNVTINQMLDNAEAINKPMRKVNVTMIESLSELKYRKDGLIKVKGDFNVNDAYQIVETPVLDAPLKVFDTLEGIHEKASGMNADTKGAADPDGKVAIYEGNKAEIADRFGLLDISYSFGYDRFSRLYELGVRDNLSKKRAIDLVGPDGVTQEMASKRQIFMKGDQYDVAVESSSDEMMETSAEKKLKMDYLNQWVTAQNARLTASPNAELYINPQKAFEIGAKVVGFKPDQIKELLDVKQDDNDAILAEADADIESILNGETIKPNASADIPYMQRFIDFLTENEEDMKPDMFKKFLDYMQQLGKPIGLNTARGIQQHFIQLLNQVTPGAALPPTMDLKTLASGMPPPQPNPAGGGLPQQTPPIPAPVAIPPIK